MLTYKKLKTMKNYNAVSTGNLKSGCGRLQEVPTIAL